jgi:hypothetical protein
MLDSDVGGVVFDRQLCAAFRFDIRDVEIATSVIQLGSRVTYNRMVEKGEDEKYDAVRLMLRNPRHRHLRNGRHVISPTAEHNGFSSPSLVARPNPSPSVSESSSTGSDDALEQSRDPDDSRKPSAAQRVYGLIKARALVQRFIHVRRQRLAKQREAVERDAVAVEIRKMTEQRTDRRRAIEALNELRRSGMEYVALYHRALLGDGADSSKVVKKFGSKAITKYLRHSTQDIIAKAEQTAAQLQTLNDQLETASQIAPGPPPVSVFSGHDNRATEYDLNEFLMRDAHLAVQRRADPLRQARSTFSKLWFSSPAPHIARHHAINADPDLEGTFRSPSTIFSETSEEDAPLSEAEGTLSLEATMDFSGTLTTKKMSSLARRSSKRFVQLCNDRKTLFFSRKNSVGVRLRGTAHDSDSSGRDEFH